MCLPEVSDLCLPLHKKAWTKAQRSETGDLNDLVLIPALLLSQCDFSLCSIYLFVKKGIGLYQLVGEFLSYLSICSSTGSLRVFFFIPLPLPIAKAHVFINVLMFSTDAHWMSSLCVRHCAVSNKARIVPGLGVPSSNEGIVCLPTWLLFKKTFSLFKIWSCSHGRLFLWEIVIRGLSLMRQMNSERLNSQFVFPC